MHPKYSTYHGTRISPQAGFTLIELLVASILLSLVLSTVYIMFYSALGNWRRVEVAFDAQRELRNAISLMQREYACALPEAAYLMEGEDDEVTLFLVAEPLALSEREGRQLLRVRYYYNRSQKELVRQEGVVETALPPPGTNGRDAERTRVKVEHEEEFVVATQVEDFSLRYLWVPLPVDRSPFVPPTYVAPQTAERHKPGWGLPQALEVRMSVGKSAAGEDPYEVVATLATRAPSERLQAEALASRLRRES
jgi:prepilin-type N-terminal cleavage/methylation domain-containing protein